MGPVVAHHRVGRRARRARRARGRVAGLAGALAIAVVVLVLVVLALAGPAAVASPRPARATGEAPSLGPAARGLIAFRDAAGIGVLDPVTGRQRLLLAVPSACTATAGLGGVPAVDLAGPVWAPSTGAGARLLFWLTDWQYHASPGCDLPLPPSFVRVGAPILVEADPFTGTLAAVAAAPTGLPCQPGADVAAVPGAIAFTDGGCDEPTVEALALPLRPGAQPVTAVLPPDRAASCGCQTVDALLGPGPAGRLLYKQVHVGSPGAPPPSLGWWSPTGRVAGLLTPAPPRVLWSHLADSAASPSGRLEAFAAGAAGAGVLDLATGAWAPMPLPACGRHCGGAVAVSFSPGGGRLAVASSGDLVVDPATGKGSPAVLLGGAGVADASWSGPIGVSLATTPPVPLARALGSLFASFAKWWGSGLTATWRVDPAAMAAPAVSVVSLPGPASALVMVSEDVALAAGGGKTWRRTDGGRTWATVTAHCAQLPMAGSDVPPCDIARMAALPGGVVLAAGGPAFGPAGGSTGIWRSTDTGLRWQRQPFKGSVIEGGPWAAGSTAYLLTAAALPNGQPVPTAASLSLLASTDAGRTWRTVLAVPRRDPSKGATAARFDRFFVLGPGRFAELYEAGDCSLPASLRLSTDGGRTWLHASPPVPLEPAALLETLPGRLVLGSRFCSAAAPSYGEGIFTHPAGAPGSWSPARLPPPYLDRYGLGPGSRFPASAPGVDPLSVAAIAFPNGADGIAVGSAVTTSTDRYGDPQADPTVTASESLVLVSHDGGTTWSDESLPGSGLELLACAGPGHCLAAG